MKLNRKIYLDKVRACFLGKNIGGTIGGPTEGKRDILDVKGFITPEGEIMPNDDLDLQLIWLRALEMQGPSHINSETLGEYWLNFIPPSWGEYGIAKANMKQGLNPEIAGSSSFNIWSHSNGAWIRSEIWACTNPLMVDQAVRYSYHDALVDHGLGEGTVAAAFVTAMESAAFAISDIRELIEIGLSKIDPSSRLAKSVKEVIRLYEAGSSWVETRNAIVKMNEDIADGWFQAPSNVAFVIIGLLYGEGDYKKSVLTAINCGDDTDCTGATVGALLGIIKGTAGLPADWVKHIGTRIVTCSINMGTSSRVPTTIDELTRRVGRMAEICAYYNGNAIYSPLLQGVDVEFTDEANEFPADLPALLKQEWALDNEQDDIRALRLTLRKDSFAVHLGAITAIFRYENGAKIKAGENKSIGLTIVNNVKSYGNEPLSAKVKMHLPSGLLSNTSAYDIEVPCWTALSKMAHSEEVTFSFLVNEIEEGKKDILFEIEVVEHGKKYYVNVPFMNR